MNKYNVYVNKDGRMRAYDKTSKKVISYPRVVLEEKLGRELEIFEDVHHLDGNPLNNDPNNLEPIMHGLHQKMHSPNKYFNKMIKCDWCGKEFVWTAKQQLSNASNSSRSNKNPVLTHFCSRSCQGKYVRQDQIRRGIRVGTGK